jgi:hypothetical protein
LGFEQGDDDDDDDNDNDDDDDAKGNEDDDEDGLISRFLNSGDNIDQNGCKNDIKLA